jgi:hypothetical protein
VTVWANQQGASTAAGEATASSQVTLTGCTSASLNPGIAVGEAGSTIVLNATSVGCVAQYEFWVKRSGEPWKVIKAFNISPTFDWDTKGLAPGSYTVEVWANQVGASTTTPEAYANSTATLTGCATVTVTVAPGSLSVPRGTTLTVSATSTGCTNPLYELWVKDPAKVWYLLWKFTGGPLTTWRLDTSRWQKGTWIFQVWGNSLNSDYSHPQALGTVTRSLT